jgi:hypothetical protein
LGLLTPAEFDDMGAKTLEIQRMLTSLVQSLKGPVLAKSQ